MSVWIVIRKSRHSGGRTVVFVAPVFAVPSHNLDAARTMLRQPTETCAIRDDAPVIRRCNRRCLRAGRRCACTDDRGRSGHPPGSAGIDHSRTHRPMEQLQYRNQQLEQQVQRLQQEGRPAAKRCGTRAAGVAAVRPGNIRSRPTHRRPPIRRRCRHRCRQHRSRARRSRRPPRRRVRSRRQSERTRRAASARHQHCRE